ncbi:MMPL family transporter [Winogradskyella ursingii]|uniref:MMPL family transporter n=1 Tax=Winogradskyella ursingii TaxID=2686079 RepID=UPI0015CADF8A|nr:MMPL family transporter [Winogradskyella ursingii]
MDRLFHSIYNFINQRHSVFALVLFVVFGLLIWSASKIKFEEDISKLIPLNSENTELQKVLNTTKFADKIIVNVNLKAEGNFSDLTNYATDLTDSLSQNFSEYISKIQGKVEDDDALSTIDFVYNNIPLFLDVEDYKTIVRKLNKDSIEAITQANYKTLISPTGIIAKSTIVKDPLGITFLGLKKLNQTGLADNLVLKNGFLVSKDEKNILLFITPKFPSSDTEVNTLFSEKLYELQDDLNEKYENQVSSSYFGGSLIAVANAKQIKTDIQFTVGIALTVLLLLFIFFYRKVTIPIILFIPTLFGGLIAISVLAIVRSEISAISLGIGAVLLGVTLDYSLHILTHIRNKESIESIYKNVSKPILMSSITTALAFLCLLFIESQALQDLGIFAAVSVVCASVFALVFIPQAYKVKSSTKKERKTFIDAIASYKFNENKILIGCIIALSLISIFTFSSVNFDKDLSHLNFVPAHLEQAEKELDAITNTSSKSLYVVTYGNSKEEVLKTNDSILSKLKALKSNQDILGFNSVSALVKSEANQQDKIEKWRQFWNQDKIDSTKANLIESGTKLGFKQNTFNKFYNHLETDFQPLKIENYKTLNTIPIEDFISENSGFTSISSIVKVDDDKIISVKETFEVFLNTVVIDRQAISEGLLGNLQKDFNSLILCSFAFVFLLLLLFYRNLKLTLVTILPIILTWFLTLGIMGLFGLKFNIFNIIITTFIFGLGVDYCIFITNGLKHQAKYSLALATHKTSVILSVITTLLGVGVLIFAKHPALHSIALISIIGIFCAMIIAFTIQPLLYNILIFKTVKKIKNGKD